MITIQERKENCKIAKFQPASSSYLLCINDASGLESLKGLTVITPFRNNLSLRKSTWGAPYSVYKLVVQEIRGIKDLI